MRNLKALPKAHLHLHLDGSIRPATFRELGGDAKRLEPGDRYRPECFFARMRATAGVISSHAALAQITEEVVEDAANDGAVWVEPSLWPGCLEGKLGADDDVIPVVLEAGQAAASRCTVGFGLMVSANRQSGPIAAERLARVAARYAPEGVVAFGLDGDERVGDIQEFARAFHVAKDAGLLATPHAGELGGSESVRSAVYVLGADRVLHGITAIGDPGLLVELVSRGICLDVCPTSNVALGVVADHMSHPLKKLMAHGVRLSVNADDTLIFASTLGTEYAALRRTYGLSDEEIAGIASSSIAASGASQTLKMQGRERVAAWLRSPAGS